MEPEVVTVEGKERMNLKEIPGVYNLSRWGFGGRGERSRDDGHISRLADWSRDCIYNQKARSEASWKGRSIHSFLGVRSESPEAHQKQVDGSRHSGLGTLASVIVARGGWSPAHSAWVLSQTRAWGWLIDEENEHWRDRQKKKPHSKKWGGSEM